jgi:cell division protein FtsL
MRKTKHYVGILIASGIVLFAFVWENVQGTKIGYSIEKLREEIERIATKNQYLKKEIQSILSTEKLEAQAKKLGMIYPEPESIIVMPESSAKKNKSRSLFAKFFNK